MSSARIGGAWLTVNRACNFRCKWCYATGTKFKPEDNMSLDEAKRLLNFIHSLGVKNIILIGGETFFWPSLFDAATYVKELGMGSTVVTNGWVLGNRRFRERVECSDITAIGISLKAGNREQNIELTQRDGFDKVLEGIRETSGWEHIRVELSTVINTATLGNIEEVVRAGFDNGAKFINLQMCGPVLEDGKFDAGYMPDVQDIVKAFVARYESINTITEGKFSLEQGLPECAWPDEFLAMLRERNQIYEGCHFRSRSGVLFDRWGRLIPCNHLYDYPMGQFGVDFADKASFDEFWNRPDLITFYDKMLAYPADACIDCASFVECGGGCPLQWFVRDPRKEIRRGQATHTS